MRNAIEDLRKSRAGKKQVQVWIPAKLFALFRRQLLDEGTTAQAILSNAITHWIMEEKP
jgi:hypothetical protein